MFEDRYLPADDPEDYELKRGEERKESSRHKHDSSSKHKKKSHHKERSASRERSHKRHKERKQPSPEEVEDGEVLEDGEIAEAAAEGVTAPAAAAAEQAAADEAAAPSAAADDAVAANGKHRSSEDDSAGHKEGKERPSSRPSSKRSNSSRERSRERLKDKEPAAAAAAGSSRERKSSRERSKDPRDKSRDRDRERSKDPREKDRDRDRKKERRERSRERSGSRRARESDGQQQQREREQPSRSRQSSRERPAAAAAAGLERYQRGSDSSRQYDRDRDRQYDRSRELQARDRDRERDSRYRSERDRQYDMSSGRGGRGGSRRSSRSRSRGRRGQDYDRDRDRDRQYKRGRDERDREDSKRRRRHSSDSEPELELDPTALLEGDALGLTAAQKEEEEQQRRLEESRKRRQEILAKHQQAAAVAAPTAAAAAAAGEAGSQQQQQLQPQQDDGAAAAEQLPQQQQQQPAAAAAAEDDGIATPEGERTSSEDSHNAPGSPVMDIWNQGAAAAAGEVSSRAAAGAAGGPDEEQPTSQLPVHLVLPGTEPNMQSERLRVGQGAAAAKSADAPAAAAAAATAKSAGDAGDAAAAADAAEGGGDDMFAAEDDMFAAEGADGAGAALRKGPAVPAGLTDNYDDAEGYYNFQVGEVLDGRYEVFACKGKGVFSTVLRARDTQRQVNAATGQLLPGVGPGPLAPGAEHPEVAIKVIRSNETMSKAAALEQRILRLLAEKDPDNRKHVIRLLRTFEYRQHVCMVFENMDMNLRELTLKYGRNVGLNIQAVAIYAGQLLVALRHLQQCRVLHADIKPDNILVNARRSKVKVCDLGSAMLAGENERTPYLVSRFYRAPEVVLGLAYDFPMDMWSVGCVLYELFTGKILFPGRSNNEMLKLMMDVKGPFPKKMLKKGIFVEKHFEDDTSMSFALIEEDPVTKQPIRRVIPNPTIKHNVSQLLARAEGDRAQLAALADLLEKMLALDPEKRIQADAALRHPFVKPWLPKKKEKGAGAGH